MSRIMAKSLKRIQINDLTWQRAGSALILATLLAITGGCQGIGSDPMSSIAGIGGGERQPIPARRAIIQSPSPGSRLARTTTFTWNPAADVDHYTFEIHGSADELDRLASIEVGQRTSVTVLIEQIDERPVLWVKLTTHHLDSQVSDPYWCEYLYPAED